MRGMMKDRKVLKMDEQVTTTRLNHSGIKEPKRIPMIMAMISLGIRPSLNDFFSIIVPPNCFVYFGMFVDFPR